MSTLLKLFLAIAILFIGCSKTSDDQTNGTADSSLVKESTHQKDWKNNKDEVNNQSLDNDFAVTVGNVKEILGDQSSFLNPEFTPDSKFLVFTNGSFSEIWLYDINSDTKEKIIEGSGCGNGFQISEDNKIFYRVKGSRRSGNKNQSIFSYDISSKKNIEIYKTQNSLSTPVLIDYYLYLREDGNPITLNTRTNQIGSEFNLPYYYVENNNLFRMTSKPKVIKVDGENYKFINCSYSSDYQNIICLTANSGILVLDIEGQLVKSYPNANYLSKLHKSKLVAITREEDDGQKITSSELFIGFLNSDKLLKLDFENSKMKFSPVWSRQNNKIALSTKNGKIKIVDLKIEI